MKSMYIFSLIVICQSNLIAQRDDGTSMRPILKEGLTYIQTLEEKNYEIVRLEFDILSDTKTTYRNLFQGWEYGIAAFGDERILDIDIAVYKDVDGTWTLIKKDTDAKPNALVVIKPSTTGLYRIDILPYKFQTGFTGCHYGLVIFHE